MLTDEDRAFLDAWDQQRRQPPRRPERTGMKCIQCYAPEYAGRPIAHTRTCPDYRASTRASAVEAVRRGVWRASVVSYQELVARLTPGRRRDRYDCPACGAPGDGHGVKVDVVGDRVLVCCFSCRNTPDILAALGMAGADLGWRAA